MKRRRARRGYARTHAGGEIQSILFPVSQFTPDGAQAWARRRGYRAPMPDLTPGYIRLRQEAPGQFARMRTIPLGAGGILAVVGWRSES